MFLRNEFLLYQSKNFQNRLLKNKRANKNNKQIDAKNIYVILNVYIVLS